MESKNYGKDEHSSYSHHQHLYFCLRGIITVEQGERAAACGPPTLVETSIHLIYNDRGGHTCIKKQKTLEAIIERAATQFLV